MLRSILNAIVPQPVLQKLKARALAAKQAVATHSPVLNGPQSPTEGMFVKEEDEELAALGGKTRLISRKSPSAYSNPSSPQESSQQSASPIEQAVGYMPTEATPPPQAASSDRKSTRLNSSHSGESRMPSSA